ncbi:MAG TPA: 3-isopropylmalate dehydratase large subunit [bacterium]|nr:3-isopropylmalate dehydratase large subunit [bacterium]
MGMTITEKILAAHSGRDSVKPGDLILAECDLMLGHDVTAPPAIKEFRKIGVDKVRDPGRLVLVNDHFVPNKDIDSAEQAKVMREFACEQEVEKYFEVGRAGVCHALLPEKGMVVPGDLVIGADSHTCTYGALGAFSTGVGSTDLAAGWATGKVWLKIPETIAIEYKGSLGKWVYGKDLILQTITKIGVDGARYRSMEFLGETVSQLTIFDRFTMANMAIEAGGKNGIFEPDEAVKEYLAGRTDRDGVYLKSDPDCEYVEKVTIDVEGMGPIVACPSLPGNGKPVGELKGTRLDQVVVGSCTNGWLPDIRLAAEVIKGKKVHPKVRMIVLPATQEIFKQAMREGLFEIFVDAGAAVSTPTCGPCIGGHMGILAEGEVAISTTNRNFIGRMGHVGSQVYLSNPAVAAASAVAGEIIHPDELG